MQAFCLTTFELALLLAFFIKFCVYTLQRLKFSHHKEIHINHIHTQTLLQCIYVCILYIIYTHTQTLFYLYYLVAHA